LVHVETIEETLDDDHSLAAADCAVEIEQDERFSKTRWEPIFGFGLAQGPSSVSYQQTLFVVDRNHDSARHAAPPREESDPEMPGGLGADSAFGEIGMMDVDALKRK
jgi:hypothetical protein